MARIAYFISLNFIDYNDLIYIGIMLFGLFMAIYLLRKIKIKENKMNQEIKAKKDMVDLEAITKNIETDYKPLRIELTSYEQEQENNAIISYDELLSSRNSQKIDYGDNLDNTMNISVKKVELANNSEDSKIVTPEIKVNLMNYEKEEAFLKALKQLQSDLIR